jgi:hypothetical protein
MRQVELGVVFFLLAGCVPAAPLPPISTDSTPKEPARIPLEDLGPAPELNNTIWLNTQKPLRLADLRGKVVLLEMWTFG